MKRSIILIVLITLVVILNGYELDLKNRITGSGRLFEESAPLRYRVYLEYQPELHLAFNRSQSQTYPQLDFLVSYDLEYQIYESSSNTEDEFDGDFYRAWIRFSQEYSDVRVGLQQVNFGSAQLIRPLQWFDTIDPREQRDITDGVHSLLYKRYFKNNANLWLWVMSEEEQFNDDFDLDTFVDNLELGGRLQIPFEYCTAAFSYHHQTISLDGDAKHTRVGVDLRWDSVIGYWVESSMDFYETDTQYYFSRQTTLGCDYTFPLGSGLYAILEHQFYTDKETSFTQQNDKASASALMLSYPISMFDTVRVLSAYNWVNEDLSHFCSISRSYDFLVLSLNLYWNPDNEMIEIFSPNEYGKSIELLLEMTF